MNKSNAIELRKKAINQAKYLAKKWFDNGWKNQTLACVDVIFPDGSREITVKDTDNKFNGFDFLYDGHVFCFVQYNGKMKITKGEKMTLKTLDDSLPEELEKDQTEKARLWHSSLSVNQWKVLEEKYTYGMINYHPSIIFQIWEKEGKPLPE